MFQCFRGISITSQEPDERRRTGRDGRRLISPSDIFPPIAAGRNSLRVRGGCGMGQPAGSGCTGKKS